MLRVETPLNDVSDWKVFRHREGQTAGRLEWFPLRKGLADVYRRSQVSQVTHRASAQQLAHLAAQEALPPPQATQLFTARQEMRGCS